MSVITQDGNVRLQRTILHHPARRMTWTDFCMQNQSTKDVEFEDQQGINRFNKLFTRSGEVEAEIKAKKVGQRL